MSTEAPYQHPDFANLTNDDLRAIAVDPAISVRVQQYAKRDLVTRIELAYHAAIDNKYDNTVEGSDEWFAADVECDRLCMELVLARRAQRGADPMTGDPA